LIAGDFVNTHRTTHLKVLQARAKIFAPKNWHLAANPFKGLLKPSHSFPFEEKCNMPLGNLRRF